VHVFGGLLKEVRLGAVFQTKNCNSILDKIENAVFLSKKMQLNFGSLAEFH
jgi:hypothetical protein